jgi:hypothetical protein
MVTTYPAKIDTSISLPLAVDNLTPVSAAIFNNQRNAVLAIETSLGVQPEGIYGTVAGRFSVLENITSNLQIIALTHDLGGTLDNPLVIGIQGRPVSNVLPNFGQALVWDGIAWIPGNVSGGGGGAPSGPAGGDLGGIYPNPTVVRIQTKTLSSSLVSIGGAQDGYVLTWVNANSDWEAIKLPSTSLSGPAGGVLSGTYPNPTLNLTGNASITGVLSSANQAAQTMGGAVGGTTAASTINLTGNANITGILPVVNQADQVMLGDVTGFTDAATVIKIRGNPVKPITLGATQDGYVLTWVNADGYLEFKPASGSSSSGELYSHFFALMPGDNAATIAQNAPILFPQDGPSNGAATRLTSSTFNLPTIGTYEVTWQASITEGAQLQLAIGGTGLADTVVSRTVGDTQLVGSVLITTSITNSVLSVINPSGNATALTMTPADGALTHSISATLTIKFLTGSGGGGGGGGGAPSGPAGGALSGTYPNPTLNLTGNANITGVLSSANQAAQTMSGDVTGTTASSTVVALRGKSLDISLASLGAAQDGYVLTWVNGSSDWQANPQIISSSWNTVLDLDFTTQPNQTLSPDGNYTIAGKLWTKENSASDDVAMNITNGVGLIITPNRSTGSNYVSFRTAPLLRLPFSSFWSTADLATRIRIYVSLGDTSTDFGSGASGRYSATGIDSNNTDYLIGLERLDNGGGSAAFSVTVFIGGGGVSGDAVGPSISPVATYNKTMCWDLDSVMPVVLKLYYTSTLVAGTPFPTLSTFQAATTMSLASDKYNFISKQISDLGLVLSCGIQGGDVAQIIHVQRVRVDVSSS